MQLGDDAIKKFESAVSKVTPEDEARVRRGFSGALKAAVKKGADSKLLDGVRSLWQMLTDKDYVLSWKTKSLIVVALGYFISPIDVVPDAVPGAGWTDDALVIAWAIHNLEGELAAYRAAKGIASA